LGLTAPAGAYLRDFQVYAPTIRSHTGSLSFACPSGKLLMGTGADINAIAAGGLALNRLGMLPNTNRTDIHALETDPFSGVWSVSGQGFCVGYTDFPPTRTTGGPYLKDPVVVPGGMSTGGSLSRQSSTTSCGGRRVIGGGFFLGPGAPPPHVAVERAEAVGTNSFGVTAHEIQPTSGKWTVQAIALCANYTDPVPGPIYAASALIYTTTFPATTTPANSLGYKGNSVSCPNNFFLIGGSARVLGATPGAVPPSQVVLTTSRPQGAPGSRSTMWTAIAVEEDPTTAAWRLESKAVCVPLVSPS